MEMIITILADWGSARISLIKRIPMNFHEFKRTGSICQVVQFEFKRTCLRKSEGVHHVLRAVRTIFRAIVQRANHAGAALPQNCGVAP